MNESEVIDVVRQAIWLVIEVSLPVLLVGLFVGVSIALLQALTQVQEITLVFVPKIIAMFIALFFFLPSMMMTLVVFTRTLMGSIVT